MKMLIFHVFLLSGLLMAEIQAESAHAQDQTFTNDLGMEFVLIPAGTFTHSWVVENKLGKEVRHQRVVTISRPFYLGKHEVTQGQWAAVMGKTPPSRFKDWNNPVENVSWDEVQGFIEKLNQKDSGGKYRLPTEAEWEYAARAGSETEWFFEDIAGALNEYTWFAQNSQNYPRFLGKKRPNPWGLYDIYGNVAEWVEDLIDGYGYYDHASFEVDPAGGPPRLVYNSERQGVDNEYGYHVTGSMNNTLWYWYKEGAVIDPVWPPLPLPPILQPSMPYRVIRGGSWKNNAEKCNSTARDKWIGGRDDLGFRLAITFTQ